MVTYFTGIDYGYIELSDNEAGLDTATHTQNKMNSESHRAKTHLGFGQTPPPPLHTTSE